MKKLICLSLVMMLVICALGACNFTQTITGAAASNADSTPKVESMMSALAENRMSDAESLMHPQVKEKSDSGSSQIKSYLNGRKTNSLTLQSINVTNSIGTSGNARQEQVTFKATLSDGEIVYINAFYLSNNAGKGFISFQIVLGII